MMMMTMMNMKAIRVLGIILPLWLACGEVPNSNQGSTEAPSMNTEGSTDISTSTISKEIQQGPVLVRTVLTPETVRLGDPFELTLSVDSEDGIEVEMPPFGEALGRLTIVDFTPRQERTEVDGVQRIVHSQSYGLQPNRSGEVVIPALRVGYRVDSDGDWQEVLTEQIPVSVTSILPTDGDLVYQSARVRLGELPVEQPWIPWAFGGVVLCMGVGLGVWWMRRRTVLESTLSAYEQASYDLKKLHDQLSTVQEDDLDAVYAGLSSVLRAYLEGRFGVSALEQTTEELRQSLPVELQFHRAVLSEADIESMLVFLSQCDAVKFAGQQFDVENAESGLNMLRRLIEKIHQASLSVERVEEHSETSKGGA